MLHSRKGSFYLAHKIWRACGFLERARRISVQRFVVTSFFVIRGAKRPATTGYRANYAPNDAAE
jgi:hypothetical protein